jgi:hypothetical protein
MRLQQYQLKDFEKFVVKNSLKVGGEDADVIVAGK